MIVYAVLQKEEVESCYGGLFLDEKVAKKIAESVQGILGGTWQVKEYEISEEHKDSILYVGANLDNYRYIPKQLFLSIQAICDYGDEHGFEEVYWPISCYLNSFVYDKDYWDNDVENNGTSPMEDLIPVLKESGCKFYLVVWEEKPVLIEK